MTLQANRPALMGEGPSDTCARVHIYELGSGGYQMRSHSDAAPGPVDEPPSRLFRGRAQNERHAQVGPTRPVETEKGLPLFADPTGKISRAAGHDASDGPVAFDAVSGELLLALTAEHE